MDTTSLFSLFKSSNSLMGKLDWMIVLSYFVVILVIGLSVSRRAGKNAESFFLGGRSKPWWLLGFSMVATTFSTDTPNLVTDIVRTKGVSGNWSWWALLLTGMLTVFIYARLWRRSGVLTDVEFYEVRYSGKWATFLRGFRSIYLGFLFNILVMGTVTLAAIKIGGILLGLTPMQTILIASIVVLIISAISGFEGVLFTDFILFILAMTGAVAAAIFSIKQLPAATNNQVVGLYGLIDALKNNPTFASDTTLNLMPRGKDLITLFIIPITVQWWAAYYPGAEPGGGGYLVQKMLAAKDEKNATAATLFFNIAHYALRPWPWIIVALASMVIFPTVEDIKNQFPLAQQVIQHDSAYPAMLTFLPHGILGMMVASLLAAYMSTIGTHLNWGSSYMANDVYKRFIRPNASGKEVVWVGRASTLVLLVLSAMVALFLKSAKQAFDLIIMMGAGTGLLLILRWFWWRINALCEFVAMVVSFIVAVILTFCKVNGNPLIPEMFHLPVNVLITTAAWLIVAYASKPTDQAVLEKFVSTINPGGLGWKKVFDDAAKRGCQIQTNATPTNIPKGILQMVLGCLAVYCALFTTGYAIYREWLKASLTFIGLLVAGVLLILTFSKVFSKEVAPRS